MQHDCQQTVRQTGRQPYRCYPFPAKTRHLPNPILNQCWATVYDAGPTLVQNWVDVSCLPGCLPSVSLAYGYAVCAQRWPKTTIFSFLPSVSQTYCRIKSGLIRRAAAQYCVPQITCQFEDVSQYECHYCG